LPAVRDGAEEVEEGPDCRPSSVVVDGRAAQNSLSFAVFAFAVDDMNALDNVITSARPFAFLPSVGSVFLGSRVLLDGSALLVPIQLAELNERCLLFPQTL